MSGKRQLFADNEQSSTFNYVGTINISLSGQSANPNQNIICIQSPGCVVGTRIVSKNFTIHKLRQCKDEVKCRGGHVSNYASQNGSAQRYKIEAGTAGYMLIIDNRTFGKIDEKTKIYVQSEEFEDRHGSIEDTMRLSRTFAAHGFKIVEKINLTDVEIIDEIKKIAEKSGKFDSLIVSILSHGDEGVVYGANGVPVKRTQILDVLASSEQLNNKPILLILQVCQGKKIMEAKKVAPYRNIFVCMSAPQGFASLRDSEKGSWFIQGLCDVIEREGNSKCLSEIMEIVTKEVSDRRAQLIIDGRQIDDVCMQPVQESTCIAKFCLPSTSIIV